MASVFHVANYFLSRSEVNTDREITHLKLQKLVYYAQAWHLALTGNKLFEDEIEAWVHGPVVPVLYYVYRKYGYSVLQKSNEEFHLSPKEKEILEGIWEAYGSLSGRYLEQMTHQEEPWINARKHHRENERSNNIISTTVMKDYYGRFLKGGN